MTMPRTWFACSVSEIAISPFSAGHGTEESLVPRLSDQVQGQWQVTVVEHKAVVSHLGLEAPLRP